MPRSPFQYFDDIKTQEIAPGFFSKLIHTENNTINFIEVAAGCSVKLHQHIHQQCSFVIEGEFEMTIGDETRVLTPACFAIIPSNAVHGGTAITNCKLVDIFDPVREDYKLLNEK
jgi:quercetin dioxygenase-like cupin family protein